MLNIACLNAGNYLGRGRQYVANLRRMVATHLAAPHRFICFTDDAHSPPGDMDMRPLPHPGINGWMNKICLFKPGIFASGEQVWFFDLDTYIVDSLDFIDAYRGRFAMLGPFFADVLQEYAGAQSGVMTWTGGFGAEIWEKFVADGCPDTLGGDQKFINDMDLKPDLLQELFPGKFASYKGHCVGSVPAGVAVVAFHGLPRPHTSSGWAQKLWRDLSIVDATRGARCSTSAA